MNDFVKKQKIEQKLSALFENTCEKNHWISSLSLSENNCIMFLLEKKDEKPVSSTDKERAHNRLANFIIKEFGVESDIVSHEGKIPNVRNPFHVSFHADIDASAYFEKQAI